MKEADVYAKNLQKMFSSSNKSFKSFGPLSKPAISTTAVRRVNLPGQSFNPRVQTQHRSQRMNTASFSIPSTSTAASIEHTSANVDIKPRLSHNFMAIGTKREANEQPSAPMQKARKTFPTPINIEIVSGFLKVNPANVFLKNNDLSTKFAELQAEKQRLENEINSQRSEIAELKANNEQLIIKMANANARWEAKLKAAKLKNCCVNCGHSGESPFYCSKNCQIAHW